MAKYKAVYEGVRYYPTLGVEVTFGDIIDLPDGTDAAGLQAVTDVPASKKPTPAPAPAAAPSEAAASETSEVN